MLKCSMNVYFALLLNFLPFLLCFVSFKFLFKVKFSTELIASFCGLIAVLPITFIQFYLMNLLPELLFNGKTDLSGLFCKFLVYNGLIEELIKLLLILFIPHKKMDLRSFFVLALLSGLCLASFESMVYFLQHLANAKKNGAELLYGLIFTRMFTSDLIHVFCAGLSAIFVWGTRHKKNYPMIFIYAVICHGLFDFFAYFNFWIRWFSLFAVLFAIVECRVKYEKIKAETVLKEVCKTEKSPLKTKKTDEEKTIVTGSVKAVSSKRKTVKTERKARSKTRVKPETQKVREKNIDIDVTPELNDEI